MAAINEYIRSSVKQYREDMEELLLAVMAAGIPAGCIEIEGPILMPSEVDKMMFSIGGNLHFTTDEVYR